jgi:O-antigen ligase
MFSHDLDRARHPLGSRAHGIVLGSIITVGATAALVSARTVAFSLAVALLAFVAAAWWRGALGNAVPRSGPVALHVAVFLAYALASTAWAYSFSTSFPSVLLACLIAIGTLVLMQLFATETRPNLLHMGEGLWAGFLVGLLYLFFELASDHALKIWVFNAIGLRPGVFSHPEYFVWSGARLISIDNELLTRNIAPATLLLWPVIAAMAGTLSPLRAMALGVFTAAIASAVVLLGQHETSKLALVVSIAAFALAHISARATGRLVVACWIFACLAILPVALILHRLDVHEASWLQFSARHRIVIWNATAERVLQSPWFGTGARTTYEVGPQLEKNNKQRKDGEFDRSISVHSHSVYLQTWFELGLIGASLLTLCGLAILQAIRTVARPLQPFAYATFASAAAMAASSYGMWQTWFVAMFGFTAAMFGLAASLHAKRPRTGA